MKPLTITALSVAAVCASAAVGGLLWMNRDSSDHAGSGNGAVVHEETADAGGNGGMAEGEDAGSRGGVGRIGRSHSAKDMSGGTIPDAEAATPANVVDAATDNVIAEAPIASKGGGVSRAYGRPDRKGGATAQGKEKPRWGYGLQQGRTSFTVTPAINSGGSATVPNVPTFPDIEGETPSADGTQAAPAIAGGMNLPAVGGTVPQPSVAQTAPAQPGKGVVTLPPPVPQRDPNRPPWPKPFTPEQELLRAQLGHQAFADWAAEAAKKRLQQ